MGFGSVSEARGVRELAEQAGDGERDLLVEVQGLTAST
jgi:hypothetical protein